MGSYLRFFGVHVGRRRGGLSLKPDEKNKNWVENNRDRRSLNAAATKAYTKSEDEYDPKTLFSDLTFTIADAPSKVQSHSASDTSSIP